MKYRKKVSKKVSKRMFTKGAMKVKAQNFAKPMRGGIRF